jgi:hypothetical protein
MAANSRKTIFPELAVTDPPTPLDVSGNSQDDGAPTDHHQDNSPNCHNDSDVAHNDEDAVDDSNPDNIASAIKTIIYFSLTLRCMRFSR